MLDGKKLGDRISEQRKEKGWSVKEFAEKLCVTEKAVYKWEKGTGIPDIGTFPTLSKLFGKPIEYFMPEMEEVKKEPVKVQVDIAKEVEKFKPLCVQHGILILDELIKIKNIKVINAFLDNYPISYYEILSEMLEKRQLKELYRFAVDCGGESLAATVILGDEQKIGQQLRHFVLSNRSGGYGDFGVPWLTSHLENLPESEKYEKPVSYTEIIWLQQLNGNYYAGSEKTTKRHLLEVLSEMEEYNG